MNLKKLNLIIGWLIFIIAATTYTITIEPTVSFWDCGEFITSAYKLEVGHPPGAPFFMILGRVISIFSFGNTALVPKLINMISALSSAFTILFLFWSITHIAKRIINTVQDELFTMAQKIAILGSGVVGALAYTFSDTFWFSAVEGEVYALSSLFTAVVFWAILKWENVADQKYANRWIILIAYLMGLSIGVHLLNLLAIPAIVLIFYFKKYKVSAKGILAALGISIAILGTMMYVIIPGVILIASKFELLFTNSFGLPYNSGTIFYIILLIAILSGGLYLTHKYKKSFFNTIILAITVVLIGYSTFSLIIIRSLADTPMNQNKPNNVFALQNYLNREQYGERPLMRGESFNAEVIGYEDGKASYAQQNGKYEIITHAIKYKYDSKYISIFPRMYSSQPNHPKGYIQWTGLTNKEKPPTMAQNLKFFFKYQIGHMYFRYFMWNFAGKQNDIQGHGSVMKGNWISGISFIDNMRLGNQKELPDYLKNNPANNKYFFFPLIFGIIGLIFLLLQNKTSKQYFWAILMFFIMTGFAILVYLNQPPFQPRERDYAYAGSFYVFSIFLGLGVLGLFTWLKKFAKPLIIAISISAFALLVVPTLMAFQNFDDHNRAKRYTAIEIAKNYLNSCEPNAILFTNGDNDTFPLWYAQEVEGIRTDVRVINLSYLNTEWYIEQMKKKAYLSEPVPFSLKNKKYKKGTRNVIYANETPGLFIREKYQANIQKYEQKYKNILDSLVIVLSYSKFPEINSKDFKQLSKGHKVVKIDEFYGLINELSKKKFIKQFEINSEEIIRLKNQTIELITSISIDYLPIDIFLRFITDDSPGSKLTVGNNEKVNYLPTTRILIPVDKKAVLKNNIVAEKDSALILPVLEWDLNTDALNKSQLMIIDLIATNNWERPIYFATTVGDQYYMNLQNYFQLDGLAYKIVPIKTKTSFMDRGRINTDILYENVMNKFNWGNINHPAVYLDENNRRMLMNLKNNYTRLAGALIKENKIDSARSVLDKCVDLIPDDKVPPSFYDIFIADNYYKIGDNEKANKIILSLFDVVKEKLYYFSTLSKKQQELLYDEKMGSLAVMNQIIVTIRENKQTKLDQQITKEFTIFLTNNYDVIRQMESLQENQQALMEWFQNLNEEDQQILQFYLMLGGYGE